MMYCMEWIDHHRSCPPKSRSGKMFCTSCSKSTVVDCKFYSKGQYYSHPSGILDDYTHPCVCGGIGRGKGGRSVMCVEKKRESFTPFAQREEGREREQTTTVQMPRV